MNEYLTIKEICAILKVSKDKVSRLCRPDKQTGKAQLEHLRVGKQIRVLREALYEYIEANTTRAEWHSPLSGSIPERPIAENVPTSARTSLLRHRHFVCFHR